MSSSLVIRARRPVGRFVVSLLPALGVSLGAGFPSPALAATCLCETDTRTGNDMFEGHGGNDLIGQRPFGGVTDEEQGNDTIVAGDGDNLVQGGPAAT